MKTFILQNGLKHLYFKEVGSTNSCAFDLARQGEPTPFWVSTKTQTQGRGRLGRSWISNEGNLYASCLRAEFGYEHPIHHLPLVAVVALYDAVIRFTHAKERPHVRVKWPNDLLWKNRKFAGILIESRKTDAGLVLIFGFGVNCHAPPDIKGRETASLKAFCAHSGENLVDAMLSALVLTFDNRLVQWNNGRGFADIRQDWLSTAVGLNAPIAINKTGRVLHGMFEALDEEGRLRLRDATGKCHIINSGEIIWSDKA